MLCCLLCMSRFFFFNDTATTEIYTLSLHDALPIGPDQHHPDARLPRGHPRDRLQQADDGADRKSTRLNSSHVRISYAVFCLKKKNKTNSLAPNKNEHHSQFQQSPSIF